jgi:TPR repeat protein
MYKKENKKSGYSEIVFAKGDQILIEIRPGGDLLFYRLDKQPHFFAYKKGSGTNIRRSYVNGSKFITISEAHEARVWDCQEDTVEALNEGKMLTTTPDFISQEQFIEMKRNDKKIFCDTRSNEFIDKLAFLTGAKLSAAILIDSGLPTILRNDRMGDRFQSLSFPSPQCLVGAFTSYKGTVLLGIADQGIVKIWHVNNSEVASFLSSSMTLEQALFIQYLVSQMRSGNKDMADFMAVPHMRRIFEGCDKTFRMLLLATFPELRNAGEDTRTQSPRISSHTTQQSSSSHESNPKLLRAVSLSAANSSPHHSPRFQSPRNIAVVSTVQSKELDHSGSLSPRKASHDSTKSAATSSGLQPLSRSQRAQRTSLHHRGSRADAAIKSPRGRSQTGEIIATPVEVVSKEPEVLLLGHLRSLSLDSSSSSTAHTEELDQSGETSPREASQNSTESAATSSGLQPLSRSQRRPRASSRHEGSQGDATRNSPRVSRQTVEIIAAPVDVVSKEPELLQVGDPRSSSPELPSSSTVYTKEPDQSGAPSPRDASFDSTESAVTSSVLKPLSRSQRRPRASSRHEGSQGDTTRNSPRVSRQTVEIIATPVDIVYKEPEVILVGDPRSSSPELPSSSSALDMSRNPQGSLKASQEAESTMRERVVIDFLTIASSSSYSSVHYEVAGEYLTDLEAYNASCALHSQRAYDHAYKTFYDMYTHTTSKLYKALSAHYLGEMNLHGHGVECNPATAFSYFRIASKQTVDRTLLAETFARLGEMYSYGYGVKQSQMQALYYLNQILAHEQDPLIGAINEAAPFKSKISALFLLHRAKWFILHRAKSQKLGTNTDLKAATILYDKALVLCENAISADGSDAPLAQLYKGRLYLTQLKESTAMLAKAWGCFMRASNSSDTYIKAEAYYRLGKLSMHNVKSSSQAKDFFEKALAVSSQTWITSMVELHLGHLASREEAAKRIPSYAKAIEFYEKALRQPFNLRAQSESSYHLARMYEKSTDLRLSAVKAWEKILEYDTQAVAVGEVFGIHHVDAHFSLARQHYTGTPALAIDLAEAYKQYMIVVNEGHDNSQLIEAYLRLAEMSQKREELSDAKEFYEKVLLIREEQGYRPTDESKKYIHKALLEIAKYELSSVKQLTSNESEGARTSSHDSLAKAHSLLVELLELSPAQELHNEAKLLQAEVKKFRTKKV